MVDNTLRFKIYSEIYEKSGAESSKPPSRPGANRERDLFLKVLTSFVTPPAVPTKLGTLRYLFISRKSGHARGNSRLLRFMRYMPLLAPVRRPPAAVCAEEYRGVWCPGPPSPSDVL